MAQKKMGIEDSPDEHYDDAQRISENTRTEYT